MKDLLYDRKLLKKVKSISNKKAKLTKRQSEVIELFYKEMIPEELDEIFEAIEKYGHPHDKNACKEIKDKYYKDELEFDDIEKLNVLYNANAKNIFKVRKD